MNYLLFDENREFDMVLLGRVAIDFNPMYNSKIKEDFSRLKNVSYFEKYVGGSPANISIGLSRHGLKVGFISKVSDDQFGEFVVDYLKKEGIDTKYINKADKKYKLGLTFTEMISANESNILMYRENIADLQLSVDDISEEYIKNSKAILISGTALSESPSREAAIKAAMLAKKNKTVVFFDIDYREYNWKNHDEISIYYSILASYADVILGSREEFNLTESLIEKGMNDSESANYWFKHNSKIIVIKHGMKGSFVYTNDGKEYSVKPFLVKARKNFGGGDGYAAGFIYGLFNNWNIEKCLTFASAEASMMIKSNNCSDDLPKEEDVLEFIDKYSEKGDV